MSKISLSIVIDKKYIEPALVTLFTLLKFEDCYKVIKLILIKKEEDSNQELDELIGLLNGFKSLFDKKDFIKILIIENKFPEFSRFHFSNAILYKIFLPIILPDDEYILNVDAGNLFQDGFFKFSMKINKLIAEKKEFVLGAFLQSSKNEMPSQIEKFSIYYPSGALLLFNTNMYMENKINTRIVNFYNKYASYLKYAEQEIMCAILDDSEFAAFGGIGDIYLDDLSSYTGENYATVDIKKLSNSIYYKNPGSIKPWKYWNLNPNKSIYLKIRNEISKFINLNEYSFIKEERESISDNLRLYKIANLLAYEDELIRR